MKVVFQICSKQHCHLLLNTWMGISHSYNFSHFQQSKKGQPTFKTVSAFIHVLKKILWVWREIIFILEPNLRKNIKCFQGEILKCFVKSYSAFQYDIKRKWDWLLLTFGGLMDITWINRLFDWETFFFHLQWLLATYPYYKSLSISGSQWGLSRFQLSQGEMQDLPKIG